MNEIIVPRTCTEVRNDGTAVASPLESFRDSAAYVLLGAPGAGKTKTFEREAEVQGGCYVTARNFTTFHNKPEWHGKTLFIDGLDESRAGSTDQGSALERICSKLYNQGCPDFRVSCREADWFGVTERSSLDAVSSSGSVLLLRLDPLSDENIREILSSYPRIDDIEEFLAAARQRGIHGLLRNPQTLKMLADAVTDGSWPESRMETFDSACQVLVGEPNIKHLQANQGRSNESDLLHAAGRLCAIQLLSGTAGYYLLPSSPQTDDIPLSRISTPSQGILREVTSTRLFEVENNLAVASHRQIAEFLGGEYLATGITEGLPARRVLSLMTGEDGIIVSELRGLAAWLAAHSKIARNELIQRDPIGTVLYGDVRNFSVSEKELIIDCLERSAEKGPWSLRSFHELDSRWGDLATPDMETAFQNVLADPDQSHEKQAVAGALLEALKRGAVVPKVHPLLMKTVRDQQRPLGIRCLALDAYTRQYGNQTKELTALLDEVDSGAVTDPEDELLGRLLRNLYPGHLSPAKLATYLRAPKSEGLSGQYQYFWTYDVEHKSTNRQLGELLDALVESNTTRQWYDPSNTTPPYLLHATPRRVLARYLKDIRSVDADRLLGWFNLIGDQWRRDDHTVQIRQWLSDHPDVYKATFKKSVEQEPLAFPSDRLLGSLPPPDFGPWCLEQAIRADSKEVGNEFLEEAVRQIDDNDSGDGFSWEMVNEQLVEHPALRERARNHLQVREQRANKISELDQEYDAQKRQRREAQYNEVKSHASKLRDNRAPASLLHHLATAYFGDYIDVEGDTPRDRLLNLLEGDVQLVDTVIAAFRLTTIRSDLPDESEIVQLAAASKVHYLSCPFMAGLEELDPTELEERQMRLALTIHFERLRPLGKMEWYSSIVSHRPDLVADILVRTVRQSWTQKVADHPSLFELADDKHAAVATLAIPQLLRSFPPRATSRQLPVLKHILRAAIRHCPAKELVQVINRKLAIRSMNVAQRIYWCCAGLLSEPAVFTSRLRKELAGGRERRVRHVASFLRSAMRIDNLDVPALVLLIQSLGGSYRPSSLMREARAFTVTHEMESAELVQGLVDRLSAIPSPDASEALEDLSTTDTLRPWRDRLWNAKARQREVRREANFRHADVGQVLQTLDNSQPANAADLAALTTDTLCDLAKRIRDGNTSDWRQYWNMATWKPEHEDTCRDRLLSDLERRFTILAIDAQPEGRYANQKRADIRVSFRRPNAGFNVPVEIKKSTHPDLWSAIHDQLIVKYARDPGADGNGIYLVFWYGPEKCTRPPSGQGPRNAQELRTRLLETLTTEQSRKIAICVIDVSRQ